MRCAYEECSAATKGYDIEKTHDLDNCPVYAVYYVCDGGHRFVAEYDRAGIEAECTNEAAA